MNMLEYYKTMYAIFMNPEYAPMLADKFEECGMDGHAESMRKLTPFNYSTFAGWLYDQYRYHFPTHEKSHCDLCYRILINDKDIPTFYRARFLNAKWSDSENVEERMQSLTYG